MVSWIERLDKELEEPVINDLTSVTEDMILVEYPAPSVHIGPAENLRIIPYAEARDLGYITAIPPVPNSRR